MAKDVVHSMAVVLLVLIFGLLLFPLWGLCMFLVFFVQSLCVFSSFASILIGKREGADCFTLNVSLVSCNCYSYVALPHSAVSWGAVCDYFLIILTYCHDFNDMIFFMEWIYKINILRMRCIKVLTPVHTVIVICHDI